MDKEKIHEFLGKKWKETDQATWFRQTNGDESSEIRVMLGRKGRFFIDAKTDFPFENENIIIHHDGHGLSVSRNHDGERFYFSDDNLSLLKKALNKFDSMDDGEE